MPIIASGIIKETELLMRYLSIASNGTYVFITDYSGLVAIIPNPLLDNMSLGY